MINWSCTWICALSVLWNTHIFVCFSNFWKPALSFLNRVEHWEIINSEMVLTAIALIINTTSFLSNLYQVISIHLILYIDKNNLWWLFKQFKYYHVLIHVESLNFGRYVRYCYNATINLCNGALCKLSLSIWPIN